MAFSARQIGNSLQVFDALTGAPHFNINIAYREMTSYFMSGNTLTVTFKTGIIEVWDLSKRSRIR